jgi:5,10-methenyltetrahydromethanopterin hydrogenase
MVKYEKQGDIMQKKIDKIKEAVEKSSTIPEEKKDLMYQRLEEWRHEKEAMRIIPDILAEISLEIRPILKEIGLL